jgi:hypothetical protein
MRGRALRRAFARIMLVTRIGNEPLIVQSPIDAKGNWSAVVPPGPYLLIAQADSGLDLQVRQHQVDVRTTTTLPTLTFDPAPRVVQILVRSLSSTYVVAYAAPATAPIPTTWPVLRKALESAPALSTSPLTPPHSDDRDTKPGDLLTSITVPGESAVVCALAEGTVQSAAPVALRVESKEVPVCVRIPPTDARVVITGR